MPLTDLDPELDPRSDVDTMRDAQYGPLLLPVSDVFTVPGRGTCVAGHIEQGFIKLGDHVGIVGMGPTRQATVAEINTTGKSVKQAKAGEEAGVILRGIKTAEIDRGQVLIRYGSIRPATRFIANIYLSREGTGGLDTIEGDHFETQFHLYAAKPFGSIRPTDASEQLTPGQTFEVEVTLEQAVVVKPGLRFTFIRNWKDWDVLGKGLVTSIDVSSLISPE